LPARIPASEWNALEPHLPALAEQWYRLDENAVPPEYCLLPRTGEFVTLALRALNGRTATLMASTVRR
jgi:hypothetical protein